MNESAPRMPSGNEGGEPKKYRIAWRQRGTGKTGYGEYIDEKSAKGSLESLKKAPENPDIEKQDLDTEYWLEEEEK